MFLAYCILLGSVRVFCLGKIELMTGVRYVGYMAVAAGRLYRRRMWRRLGRGFRGSSADAEAEITRGIELGVVDLP